MSVRRHQIRSRCSKRWWEDHSRQVGQQEGEKEVGLSVSTLVMLRMICQLFYKLFPRFLSFFLFVFLECQVSVAPKPTQTKPEA